VARRPEPDWVAGRLGYGFAVLGVLASLVLGLVTLLIAMPPSADPDDPDNPDSPRPSISVEETAASRGPVEAGQPTHLDPRQANLVRAEDQRVFTLVSQVLPGTAPREFSWPAAPPTLVLPSRVSAYTLTDLMAASAVRRQPDQSLLLVKNVLVAPGAQLQLLLPDGRLRMSSTPAGFTTLIAFKGSIELAGQPSHPLNVTSWDPASNQPDTDTSDGRSYLRAIGGRLELREVDAADLGFWSGRTGGLAWTGSASEPATGTATDLTVTGNLYGMFLTRCNGVLVNGAQVRHSVLDGVAVHSGATGTQLWRVSSEASGRNGIAVTGGASDTALREVSAVGNVGNGIYLDGTPPAAGPNAGGGTTAPAAGFSVDSSTARGNSEHGILVRGATDVRLTNNTVAANRDGVIIRGTAAGVVLRGNHISSPDGFGVAIRGGAPNVVVDTNVISNALIGVQVADSVATITGNEIDAMALHGVSLIGRSGGSAVSRNRVGGRGPSAVDVHRRAFGALITQSLNDEAGWTVDHDDARYVSSALRRKPLLLLWGLILVLPLGARVAYKRRHQVRAPYRPEPPTPPVPPARPSPVPPRDGSTARTVTPSPRPPDDPAPQVPAPEVRSDQSDPEQQPRENHGPDGPRAMAVPPK
jgi:parallel beta-helix repeat protein